MMKNKLRYFMVLTALAMCFGTFSVTAYAQSNEPQEETAPVEETTEPEETATPNPFTPNGTGTVLDNATSEDEKEFYSGTRGPRYGRGGDGGNAPPDF